MYEMIAHPSADFDMLCNFFERFEEGSIEGDWYCFFQKKMK